MNPVIGEKYIYDRPGDVWDGVILEHMRTNNNFSRFTVIEAPSHFISAGGVVGREYLLDHKYLKPVEPEYLQYDPAQQEDLDSDI